MKTYFKPTTESIEFEMKWALCTGEGSEPEHSGVGGSPSDRDAPRRRVFY